MASSASVTLSPDALRDRLVDCIADPSSIGRLPLPELDVVLRALRKVRLLGWLAVRLEAAGVLEELPEAAVEQLTSARAVTDSRARLARWELDRIGWALRDSDVGQVVAMKGCAYLLRDLPNAAGRLFADVDLMVAEKDLDAVENVLARHGWEAAELTPYDERFYRAWSHELPAMVHVEREVEVDIHHNIRGRYAPFKPDPGRMLAAARPIEGSRFESLSDPDIVLHAMTHLMFGGDLGDGLRDLVDVDILLRHFAGADEEFWSSLVSRADDLGLGLPAFYTLRYAVRMLDTPVPAEVTDALARHAPSVPVLRLMDRLVPAALFPLHPDCPKRSTAVARWMLYVRSHWVSMPPVMLVRHLTYKFYVRHVQWRFGG